MDSLKWNINTKLPIQKKCKHLSGKLQAARNKLTPIVDDIISSAVDLIQKGDNKFLNETTITTEQYQDVLWASEIMKEMVYEFKINPTVADRWPNTDIIVNNVSVDYQNRTSSGKGKSIVIDEVTIVQLLELYEQMGEVIQRITEEANQQGEVPTREKTRSNIKSSTSVKSIKSDKGHAMSSEKQLTTTSSSEKTDDFSPQIKSTLSVIQKSSSGELNKKHGVKYSNTSGNKSSGEDTNVFIRIQCISDYSEGERDGNFQTESLPANCVKQSSPHHHLRLGGEPVILKVNQANVEKGAVYCINTGTGGEENDIKIFIKQCPECLSTVIGSTSKIKDMPGESHESVTLHGKGRFDETQMAFSSDDTTDSYKEEPPSLEPQELAPLELEPLELEELHRSESQFRKSVLRKPDSSHRDFKQESSHRSVHKEDSSVHDVRKEESSKYVPQRDESHKSIKSSERSKVSTAFESGCGCSGIQQICIDITASHCSCEELEECSNKLRISAVPSHVIINDHRVIKDPSMVRDPSMARDPSVVRDPSVARDASVVRDPSVVRDASVIRDPSVVRDASVVVRGSSRVDEPSLVPNVIHERDDFEKSTTKIDVLIDADNVDKSTVKFTGSKESAEEMASIPEHASSPTSVTKMKSSVEVIHSREESVVKQPSKQKSLIPLMRRRICSSMEFDVTTVNTRLRDHEIEHNNPHIVVELKEMGVDHLLRACRPAKCCRKAILDERQRTALPYCVSLKSLPLMGNDVEVIKQSYDMSLRKIKNALDLTQHQKDKLAYYVNLGRDDFRPTINFPWVISVYDMKQHVISNSRNDEEKFYVLRNSQDLKSQKPRSMSNVLKLLKDKQKQQKRMAISNTQRKIRTERYFVLKQLKPSSLSDTESQIIVNKRCATKNIRRKRMMKFAKAGGDKNYLDKMIDWGRSRSKYNREALKNTGSNVDHGDHVIFFDNRNRKKFSDKNSSFDSNLDDILFNLKKKVSNLNCHSRSESDVSLHYESLSQLFDLDFRSYDKERVFHTKKLSRQLSLQDFMEIEDYPNLPIDEMIEVCLESINGLKYNYQIAPKKSFSDTHLTSKGRSRLTNTESSNYWNHISEELFYTSSAITIFMKRTRSVGRMPKTKQNSYCKQIESEISCYVDAARLEAEKETESPKFRKKLEYYVSLINGDLIWGQSLPLVPQKYDAYYNYSDSESIKSPKGSRTSVRRRDRQNESSFEHRNTLDEIPPQNYGHQSDSRPIPVNSVESESPYTEWAPFLISEHSLPGLGVVEQIKKVQQAPVEAAKPKPEPLYSKECAKKQTCIDNKCKTCTGKVCERPKKKCHGQANIVIGIQKTRSKCNAHCTKRATEKKVCNKEVCELYKNKMLVPENKEKCKEPCNPCDNKTLTIKPKDNIQIVIKDKKISVLNEDKKSGKKSKERKEEK